MVLSCAFKVKKYKNSRKFLIFIYVRMFVQEKNFAEL